MSDSRMTSDLSAMIDKLGRDVRKLEESEVEKVGDTCTAHGQMTLCLRHNIEGTQLSLSCMKEMREQQEEIYQNTKLTSELLQDMRTGKPQTTQMASLGWGKGAIKGPWQMVMAIAALAIFVGSIVGGMYSVAKLFLDKKPSRPAVEQPATVKTP